jgi:hypothetical protein
MINKPNIVKFLVQEQNKINPEKFQGNLHLFNCLADIRHTGISTESRDDLIVIDKSVWYMDRWGDMWRTISWGDCDLLRRMLFVGLDVNQSIQLCNSDGKSEVERPLLYTLIDEEYARYRTEKVEILLGAGADINARVKYRMCNTRLGYTGYDSVLDKEGVYILERVRRWMYEYSDRIKYEKMMCEIKKHVRRHSV